MSKSTAYSAHTESLKLSILLTCLCLSILYGDWVWRWDRLIYDVQSSLITHKASDDIVIIAVDETSLHSIGRWPWPRSIHAALIDKLTEYQAKAIVIDIIFSEPSIEADNDQKLAAAIQRNGTVILPVLLEQTRLQGHLLETLPLPSLTQTTAGIGHVHVELDPDGIARGSYLYEGLGEARWPHIGMSVLQLLNDVHPSYLNATSVDQSLISSPWTWMRSRHFLIPYIGPPGSFKTTSYINILNDQVLPEEIKDKIVLLGVTAAGLGDSLPTPVSGHARSMPGIEINANIVQAIKTGTLIEAIATPAHYILASVLILLPIILFTYLSPRLTLLLVVSEIILIFIMSTISLHWFHLWVPISAVVFCLLLSYPLWAWRRLEFTVRYLNSELNNLSLEASEIERYVAQDSPPPLESLQSFIPVTGLTIFGPKNKPVTEIGDNCIQPTNNLSVDIWSKIADYTYARRILIGNNYHNICIRWDGDTPPDEQQYKILKTYIRQLIKPEYDQAKTTVEIIESRIRDIRKTTDKLVYLRQFITDSLEQMADGVIVIDSLGTVTLANRQAMNHINWNSSASLLHQNINPILQSLTITGSESWDAITRSLLSNKHYENLQVRTNNNKDLIINIRSLYKTDNSIAGFIINLSDISEIKDAQRKRNEMLSFLSHDLRSPLVSVLATLEKSKLDNKHDTLNKRIELNVNHTIQLAEDFIHLSRVESDDDIIFNSLNLPDVIANAIDTVWDQASLKNIKIKQLLINEAWVHGNGAILERVIINLLTNAIKYSHENCLVTVNITKENDNIICCIKDNGPGIDKNEIPYLFDRFSRAKQQDNRSSNSNQGVSQGTGLGLAFVHAAVEKHHGTITVTSKLNEGTSFCITMNEEKNKGQ